MSVKKFPERQRCQKCKHKLGNIVVSGVFCSYSCASFPAPSPNVSKAPRSCKREINGSWGFKKRYRSESEVPQKLRDDPGTNIYECEYCHHLHVGHSRPQPTYSRESLTRKIGDSLTMGTVLSRLRQDKNITIKQLATKIHTTQIRIKEVETNSPQAQLPIAIKMIYALGCNLILQEKHK